MIDAALAYLAPHHCCGCGKTGAVLCSSCANNIISERFAWCAVCTERSARETGLCDICRPPYSRVWVLGVHEGMLDAVIDVYKFDAAREAGATLATLMDMHLPELPANVVFVPIPTVAAHVRQRGFDHMKLLARRVAVLRERTCDTSLLRRRTQTVQRGMSARQRERRAKEAFRVVGSPDDTKTYVLVDDVMTTGSTLHYAAKALQEAGAADVWVVVIARQVLS